MRTFLFLWASRLQAAGAAGLLALLLSGAAQPARAQAPADPVTYQTFYDALSPYGQWVSDPDYGYAWVPTAGADFQPYRSNGHWVYTDYGWTWVSDYAWGWAPFHYGRWRYSDGYGWLWVPGYSWGPAWVAWRQSAGYYGWAPLGPPPVRSGVRVSIGFSFSFGDAPVAPARWCFVPAAYVASPRIATYYVPPAQTTVVYNQTTVIRNTYINKTVINNNSTNTTVLNNRQRGGPPVAGQPAFPAGPPRAAVEKATGQQIQPLAVTNRATPGTGVQGQALAFYRPTVAAPPASGARGGGAPGAAPAPRRVVPLADAARQARAARPDAAPGLVRDNPAQQLNSTDAHPFRDARAAAASQPQPAGGNAPGQPGAAGNGRRTRFDNAGPAATPGATPGQNATDPTTDQATRQQLRQQRQQARLQNMGSPQPSQQAQAQPLQNQQLREQRMQQRQAQQQQQQAQQQQLQQQRQQDQQARQQQQMQQRQAQQQMRQQQQQAHQQQQQMRQQQQQQARAEEHPQFRGGGERRR